MICKKKLNLHRYTMSVEPMKMKVMEAQMKKSDKEASEERERLQRILNERKKLPFTTSAERFFINSLNGEDLKSYEDYKILMRSKNLSLKDFPMPPIEKIEKKEENKDEKQPEEKKEEKQPEEKKDEQKPLEEKKELSEKEEEERKIVKIKLWRHIGKLLQQDKMKEVKTPKEGFTHFIKKKEWKEWKDIKSIAQGKHTLPYKGYINEVEVKGDVVFIPNNYPSRRSLEGMKDNIISGVEASNEKFWNKILEEK